MPSVYHKKRSTNSSQGGSPSKNNKLPLNHGHHRVRRVKRRIRLISLDGEGGTVNPRINPKPSIRAEGTP